MTAWQVDSSHQSPADLLLVFYVINLQSDAGLRKRLSTTTLYVLTVDVVVAGTVDSSKFHAIMEYARHVRIIRA